MYILQPITCLEGAESLVHKANHMQGLRMQMILKQVKAQVAQSIVLLWQIFTILG